MYKLILSGAILIGSAIILGAMAAHSLETILNKDLLESFEKAVRYQFYAGFSLLIMGGLSDKVSFSLNWFKRLTLIGAFLFSGCIYLYCFHELIPALKPFVYIVPFGGMSMIAAWIIFCVQLIRSKKSK
jgi:uncharacterized membrane protein YgdD (TMEM256/DUF423 family)